MRFLKINCLFYNFPYNNWIHFAKAFFDCRLNPIYIDEYRNYCFIYYNIIRSKLGIRDAINDLNRITNNKLNRIWIFRLIYI